MSYFSIVLGNCTTALGQVRIDFIEGDEVWVTQDLNINRGSETGSFASALIHQAHRSDGLTTLDPPIGFTDIVHFDGDIFSRAVSRYMNEFIDRCTTARSQGHISTSAQQMAERVLVEIKEQRFMPGPPYPSSSDILRFDISVAKMDGTIEGPIAPDLPNGSSSLLNRIRERLGRTRNYLSLE